VIESELYYKKSSMKSVVLLLIVFMFISSSYNGENKHKVIENEFANNEQKIDLDKISTIQKLIIGRWLEIDGYSNNIMTISNDSIIGGIAQSCWPKYKIKLENHHMTKPKNGQYWIGFAHKRCNDNRSFNYYFGNILVDSLFLICHAGIDESETVIFKKLK
jgi:hypothetical protein